jgi:hypothetical protein
MKLFKCNVVFNKVSGFAIDHEKTIYIVAETLKDASEYAAKVHDMETCSIEEVSDEVKIAGI